MSDFTGLNAVIARVLARGNLKANWGDFDSLSNSKINTWEIASLGKNPISQ